MLTPAGFYAPQLRDIPGLAGPAPVMAKHSLGLVTTTTNRRLRDDSPGEETPRELITKTFNTAGTFPWIAPSTTSALAGLEGRGEDGQPDDPGGYWWFLTTTTTDLNTGKVTRSYDTGKGFAPGSDYCEGIMGSGGVNKQVCYAYKQYYSEPESSTYGASGNAFGITFPGGNARPAVKVVANVSLVAIQPNITYNITVPTGGYITFSYYQ